MLLSPPEAPTVHCPATPLAAESGPKETGVLPSCNIFSATPCAVELESNVSKFVLLAGLVTSVITAFTVMPAGQLNPMLKDLSPAVLPTGSSEVTGTGGRGTLRSGCVTEQVDAVIPTDPPRLNVAVTGEGEMQLPLNVSVIVGSDVNTPDETAPVITNLADT